MTDLPVMLAAALIPLGLAACLAGALAGARVSAGVAGRVADLLGGTACLVALAAWLGRWGSAGHMPLFGTFESALSLCLAVLAAAMLARRRLPGGSGLWLPVGTMVAVLMAHGMGYSTQVFALTISERSWWVELHALIAWAAFGIFLANAGLAFLVIRRPGDEVAENRMIFTLRLAFAAHAAMLASGSFYKFLLFGRTWSFDPIETLGLLAWVAYGTLLHMQLLAGWHGRRLASWCLILFLLLLVSYRGIVYFPGWSTYHIFDVDLRFHE